MALTTSFASSSTSPSHGHVYDVFISHYGPDVRKGIASHIYHRLKSSRLEVFLDKPALLSGENLNLQIEEAIQTASVHIAIFSPRYARSRSCLDELVLMVESGSTIIPIFYNVQPSDLRWTRRGDRVYARALSIFLCILLSILCIPTSFLLCVPFSIIMCIIFYTRGENGVYAQALHTLQKKTTVDSATKKNMPRHDSDTIEKWRKALSVVSKISGFELKACNGDEGQLVDEVIQQVSIKVLGSAHSPVYDVFISHRGPDVKKGIASHIYYRLKRLGIAVFLDQQELQKGKNLNLQLEGAIQTASVQIAIFSPTYANSRWCLDELLLMVESGSTIIPVYYNVQPSDLRRTRGGDGVYARALRTLQKKRAVDSETNKKKPRHNSNTIEKWRKALSDVSKISGFELKECNGDEGQLVNEVVKQVFIKVRKPSLNVAEYPTGLLEKVNVAKYPTGLLEKVEDVERIVSLHRQSGKASIVGIVGLGGIGKTTLAKELFNRERSNYDRSCFLVDVRSKSLPSLQSILLKNLMIASKDPSNVDEGIEMLKKHLSSLQVLIVLDDVDDIKQLKVLFSPFKDTIDPGSLILITSRNRDVLRSSGIGDSSIYTMKVLNSEHSRELFCLHAFGQPHPVVGFEEAVENFLDACIGLPLSLRVLGALLHGNNDLVYWNAQLHKTSEILPDDIGSTLKISYDALDKDEKQIFLDIACFFIGEDRDAAIRIWDGSRWHGLLACRSWKIDAWWRWTVRTV